MHAAGGPDIAPSWETWPGTLPCPRCGYDMRMLTEPRCPECGLRTTWTELIAAAEQRSSCPLFEYQWRRQPVRSLLRTIGETMLPWRVWQTVRMTDAPRAGPLIATHALTAALGFVLLAVACSVAVAVQFPPASLPRNYYVRLVAWSILPYVWRAWLAHGALTLCVLAASLVLRRTLHRYRIRWVHLFRIAVLTNVGMLAWWGAATVALGVLNIAAPNLDIDEWGYYFREIPIAVYALTASICAWSLYLQTPRGWCDALLTLFLAAWLMGTVTYATAIPGDPTHGLAGWCCGAWPSAFNAAWWFAYTILGLR